MKFHVEVEMDYLNDDAYIDDEFKYWIKNDLKQAVIDQVTQKIIDRVYSENEFGDSMLEIGNQIRENVRKAVKAELVGVEQRIAQTIATKMIMQNDLKESEETITRLIENVIAKRLGSGR